MAIAWDTIHVRSLFLKHAVPMDARSFVIDLIMNGNFDPIAPVGFYQWTGELSID